MHILICDYTGPVQDTRDYDHSVLSLAKSRRDQPHNRRSVRGGWHPRTTIPSRDLIGQRSLNNCRIFPSSWLWRQSLLQDCLQKLCCIYQSLTIASYFVCSVPLTIILLTLFQELLKNTPMVMILSVFLTLSSYSLTICHAMRSYNRNGNRHRANLSHNFRFGNLPKTCHVFAVVVVAVI